MQTLGCGWSRCELWLLWQDGVVKVTQVRVGEVGGNSLGLYGAIFSPRGNQILAHGYQGAFHLWRSVSNHDDKACQNVLY